MYDPSGGFVTGGGWIDSPPGAYRAAPSLVGRANFGLVAKYKEGSDAPDGTTEFQFHTASFNFLWWYHYKPGSDLYVVYNQGWDTDLPLTSRDVPTPWSRVRSRSLAIKMTYWLAP